MNTELKPEDVMRALECCVGKKCFGTSGHCPLFDWDEENTMALCTTKMCKAALSLLREKDKEIERLQGALKAEETHNELTMECAKKALANAQAEAVDEFSERLKKGLSRIPQHHFNLAEVESRIEYLKNEMKGDKE